LLRRFRLRSLSFGGQVAPRNVRAMTVEHDFAISPRRAPEVCQESFALSMKGRGEYRALDAPAASHAK